MNIKLDEFSLRKINLIDEFRGRFSMADNEKLKLPQIIVVGDQSSGKSSILEAISGIKLPRGVDTVTKCPVVIQMRHSEIEKKQIKCGSDEFREIQDTRREIRRVQRDKLNDQLTEEPITLHIESPNVETLTIIDLPGIVKTKTSDQSEDIIEMTHNIAKMYMKQENSLIICVLPANQDISTTTTIKLASECNDTKSRIIGVLTKLDKIDKEASLLPDILQNKKLPIKKGYYGLVVGDEFLESDSEHREIFEINCFRKINIWPDYKSRLGLANFIGALVNELMVLINETLPRLDSNIANLITETENEIIVLSKYHDNPQVQPMHLMKIIYNVMKHIDNVMVKADGEIHHFSKVEEYLITQKYLTSIGPHTTFLFLWHNIYKWLYDEFYMRYRELFEVQHAPYKDLEILDGLIKECRVENAIVFNISKPFKIIVDEVLDLFKVVCLLCVEKCYKIIINLIDKVLTIDIEKQFKTIKLDVKNICIDILRKQNNEIRNTLDFLFKSEHSYFTQDAIFELHVEYMKSLEPEIIFNQPTPISQSLTFASPKTKLVGRKLSTVPITTINQPAMFNKPISTTHQSNNLFGSFQLQTPEDEEKLNNEIYQYKNAQHLKQCLERYIENLILRLGHCVPNFIRLTLFENFKEEVELQLASKLTSPEKLKKYFSLSDSEVENCNRLKKRLASLKQSKTDLDNMMLSDE